MAYSKSNRKKKVCKYFSCFTRKSSIGGSMWYVVKAIHASDLTGLIGRELQTRRMRNKCISYVDYEQVQPLFRRWSAPVVFDNPCKKSRIKKHFNTYRILHADDVPCPDGKGTYTKYELMNLHISKGNEEEDI